MRRGKPTVVFSGMLAGDPHQGGGTRAGLQYVPGFPPPGYEVLFVEPVKPTGRPLAETAAAAYFREVVAAADLAESAALLVGGTQETVGLSYGSLVRWAREADVLVNVSGMLTDPALTGPVPTRVYLDLDP